jgi:hypothetical protein
MNYNIHYFLGVFILYEGIMVEIDTEYWVVGIFGNTNKLV